MQSNSYVPIIYPVFQHVQDISADHATIELSRLNITLKVLNTVPSNSAKAIIPLMVDTVYNPTPVNATFIRSYMQRGTYYYTRNPNRVDVTLQEADFMLSKRIFLMKRINFR